MMSQCMVPNWNLSGHQRQEQIEGEDGNRSPHVHPGRTPDTTTPYLVPMNLPGLKFGSNHEVAELTWENGQVAMHGLGGLHPTPAPTKPTWGRSNGTLEAIVHQATRHAVTPPNETSAAASSGGQREERSGQVLVVPSVVKKRTRADPGRCMVKNFTNIVQEDYQRTDRSPCASDASATFGSKNDSTRITWSSYESPPSLKTKTMDEDSACRGGSQNRDEDAETKADTGRSHPTRRTRAAAVHNQSERRRRDRINQKMKTLQKLVPNASKTDKASMLDEVIEYLKQLQAQVQMMSSGTSMPRMMMMMPALGMQQHLQMSVQLARMGMLDINPMACAAAAASHSIPPAATTAFVVPPAPPFMVPSMVARCPAGSGSQDAGTGPLVDPYWSFLAQSMNADFFNKMAALYRQQVHQSTQATSNASQSSRVHGD